jgi:hypothetical protein
LDFQDACYLEFVVSWVRDVSEILYTLHTRPNIAVVSPSVFYERFVAFLHDSFYIPYDVGSGTPDPTSVLVNLTE